MVLENLALDNCGGMPETPNLVCGMCHILPAEEVHQVMA